MCFSFDFSFAKLICNFWSCVFLLLLLLLFFGIGIGEVCLLPGNMNNSAYDCVLGRIALPVWPMPNETVINANELMKSRVFCFLFTFLLIPSAHQCQVQQGRGGREMERE